jgi:glucosylceramidase
MKTTHVSQLVIGIVSLLAACSASPGTNTGTAGTNGGAGTAGTITCTTGTACGQSCVNTATDNNNCGTCGNLCGIGQSCQASQCVCQTGLILCNGLCVQSDANHCGTCTMTCSAGQVCSNNACTSEGCTGSQMMCGTACVDTTSSDTNCGSCGHACTAGQRCMSSTCVETGGPGTAGTTGTAGTSGPGTAGTTGTAGATGTAGRGGTTGSAGATGTAGRGGTTGTAGTGTVTPSMVLVTSASGNYWKTGTLTESTAAATVTVNDTSLGQKWDGFGGAFNELGWSVLTTPAMQTQAVTLLFSATEGANFTWGRIPIGASDYAMTRYTNDDTGTDVTATSAGTNRPPADTTLQMFSLARDGQRLIPYIKAAQGVKPDLRFWASPWTPPVWMKTGYKMDSGGTGGGNAKKPSYFDGGNMVNSAANLAAYAQLYTKFVTGYKGQGINIEIVSPQNEPGYDQNYPSCLWDSATYIAWVGQHLGPAMKTIGVKVMLGTMSNAGDANRNDINIATAVLADATAKSFLSVAGVQWGVLDKVNGGQTFSGLPIWATEHKCGNYPWNPGTGCGETNSSCPTYNNTMAPNDQAYGVESWIYIRNAITKGKVTSYSAWNMVLDRVGLGNDTSRDWKQDALLAVNGTTITQTPAYYVFRHLSQYVVPGANVVATSGGDAVAFKNPDGSIVVATYNSGAANNSYVVAIGGKKFSFAMPGQGWATVKYKP